MTNLPDMKKPGTYLSILYVVSVIFVLQISDHPVLGVARVTVVILGLLIASYALEVYRKLAEKPFFYQALGFGLFSLSMVIQGIFYEFSISSPLFGGLRPIFVAMYFQTILMAAGMAAVLYSYHCRK